MGAGPAVIRKWYWLLKMARAPFTRFPRAGRGVPRGSIQGWMSPENRSEREIGIWREPTCHIHWVT